MGREDDEIDAIVDDSLMEHKGGQNEYKNKKAQTLVYITAAYTFSR